MRILLVTETLAVGGAETFVLRLARKVMQLGHRCDVLCLNPDLVDRRMVDQFPEVSVLQLRLPALRWIKRFDRALKFAGIDWSLQFVLTARSVSRHVIGRYDVYHTHLFGSDYLFAFLKRRFPDIRLVSTLHGDYIIYEAGRSAAASNYVLNWHAKLDRILETIDRWVCISQRQYADLAERFGVGPDRLVTIYNGYEPTIPLAPRTCEESKPLTFIMVARGIREKGWSILLEAFSLLQADARLVLVGDGAYLKNLEPTYSGDSRIRFVGFHPTPIQLVHEADVFVFPSIYTAESLPTVVVEALHCGVPVIATAVGEISRMIEAMNGDRAGQLLPVDPHDKIAPALAAAMRLYIDDTELLKRHCALARDAFTKFDMELCTRRYIALYHQVAA